MLDYGAFPPEVNSGRIYAGAGSAPMMAAAAAWSGVAAELTSAATAAQTVISRLTGEEWRGSASAAMAAATAPYLAWLNTTASQAEHAATQAAAGAAAFEAARAASAPPAVIAANRAQLAALVATNALGLNTAAIAACETQYCAMWAQDAVAMYGYAAAAAAAAQLTPINAPAQTTNPAGTAGQAAAVTQAAGNGEAAQALSSMPGALQGLSAPIAASAAASPLPTWLTSILDTMNALGSNSFIAAAAQGLGTAAVYIPPTLLPTMIGYYAGAGFNALGGGVSGASIGELLLPGGPLSALGALGGGAIGGAASAASAVSAAPALAAPMVSATLGQAQLVGSLSTPQAWAATTPASDASTALQTSGWNAAPESNSVAAMPGAMPAGAGNRGSFGFGTPRYGFKPTVMPRPVIAG